MSRQYRVAVVGVGVVGEEILRVLDDVEFPASQVTVMARSARRQTLAGAEREVLETTLDTLREADIALFAGTEGEKGASALFGWDAAEAGTLVIDNGSDFRMDPRVPLVVPEVNPDALEGHQNFIANPNCSTIQMVVALAPLHRAAGIRRVVVSTYQAVSGTGGAGKRALAEQREGARAGAEGFDTGPYTRQIYDNVIPHIGGPSETVPGFFSEEIKMILETRKILDAPDLPVTATCVRVPVLNAHSEAINVEFERPLSADEAREILAGAPGVTVVDDPAADLYPTPLEAAGRNPVYVGRIRKDPSNANALDLWCVADNIRKGAALNAVQIAQEMIRRGLL
jgi:aspartate-semialdehyde dehydrogenase